MSKCSISKDLKLFRRYSEYLFKLVGLAIWNVMAEFQDHSCLSQVGSVDTLMIVPLGSTVWYLTTTE